MARFAFASSIRAVSPAASALASCSSALLTAARMEATIGFSGAVRAREESAAPRTFDDPAEGEWVTRRRTPHPRACFTEPVHLAKPLEDFPFTRSYIKATVEVAGEPGGAAFWRAAKHAEASPAWRYFEIATNHMVASNKPAETAELLMKATADEH